MYNFQYVTTPFILTNLVFGEPVKDKEARKENEKDPEKANKEANKIEEAARDNKIFSVTLVLE